MNKLSDYRIKETPDGFIIEKWFENTERNLFGKGKKDGAWHELNVYNEKAYHKTDLRGEISYADTMYATERFRPKVYETRNLAADVIIYLCEKPKYHYIAESNKFFGKEICVKLSDIKPNEKFVKFMEKLNCEIKPTIEDVERVLTNQVKDAFEKPKTVEIKFDTDKAVEMIKVIQNQMSITKLQVQVSKLTAENAKLKGIIEGLKSKK